MKKHFILLTIFLFNISFLFSQTYTAKLSIDAINVSELKPGDDIVVPVRLVKKSGGMIVGFQLFIEFDHSLFSWKGVSESPLPGVINFNKNMLYNPADWLFNDNGNQMVALWNDPKLIGVEMNDGDIFFEYVFTYSGGLNTGDNSVLSWGETFEMENAVVVRGVTEMYSDKFDYFVLTKQDGKIKK
ncbi:MAG: hypothetical protein K8R68_03585 [Bacteroidales bacterium]|nr:hypothetical protein [Bacteroidales bacterium]